MRSDFGCHWRSLWAASVFAGAGYLVWYNAVGRESQVSSSDGTLVGRTYDSRNLLSTISYAGGTIDTRTYDAGGRLSRETLGNGLVVTRAYLTGDNLPALIANAAVGNYGYGWDANKNKTSETITAGWPRLIRFGIYRGGDSQRRFLCRVFTLE